VEANVSGVYVFDTNILIDLCRRYYPVARFPTLHTWVDVLIDAGRVVVPNIVRTELEGFDDDVFKWLKAREDKVVKPHDINVQ
jgi:hypothetical protein